MRSASLKLLGLHQLEQLAVCCKFLFGTQSGLVWGPVDLCTKFDNHNVWKGSGPMTSMESTLRVKEAASPLDLRTLHTSSVQWSICVYLPCPSVGNRRTLELALLCHATAS